MKNTDQANPFSLYAAALAAELGATLEPYEGDRGNEWRTRLTLPGGARLFLRDSKGNRAELWPMGPGSANARLLGESIGASLTAHPGRMAKRALSLLAPGGEWRVAIDSAEAGAERERQAIARSQAAADALRAAGFEVRESGSSPGSFHAYKQARRQTVSAEIQHGGSVTFRNLYVSAEEAIAIAAAL